MSFERLIKDSSSSGSLYEVFEIHRVGATHRTRHYHTSWADHPSAHSDAVSAPVTETLFDLSSSARRSASRMIMLRLSDGWRRVYDSRGHIDNLFDSSIVPRITRHKRKKAPRPKAATCSTYPFYGKPVTPPAATEAEIPLSAMLKPASAAEPPPPPPPPPPPLPPVVDDVADESSREELSSFTVDTDSYKREGQRCFLVARREVHVTWYVVGAKNPQGSIHAVEDGQGIDLRTDYMDTQGAETWSALDITDAQIPPDRFGEFLDTCLANEVDRLRKSKTPRRDAPKPLKTSKPVKSAEPWTKSAGARQLGYVAPGTRKTYDVRSEIAALGFRFSGAPYKRWEKLIPSGKWEDTADAIEALGCELRHATD